MHDDFPIRAVTNADGAAVRQLVFSVLRDYGLAPDPDNTDRDLSDLATHYAPPGSFYVMLDGTPGDHATIIGTVGIYRLDAARCELRKMYLSPTHRGRGLGRRLLEHALHEARSAGFRRVELETASVLKEAITLYRRYGFREFTPEHMAARCDQAFYLELPAAGG